MTTTVAGRQSSVFGQASRATGRTTITPTDVVRQQNAAVAGKYRDRLIAHYGAERWRTVKYAEAFELCQYGRQPAADELKKMFPTFD